MTTVSLNYLKDREHALFDDEYDGMEGLCRHTPVDRYMELNHARMGEDSEVVALRQKHQNKVLQRGSIPDYQPF